jgi:integrase/recombinase XerC
MLLSDARPVAPHGLRHASITHARDLGRDLRDVAKFSRHKNIQTLLVYDDNRRDVGGEIARQIDGA